MNIYQLYYVNSEDKKPVTKMYIDKEGTGDAFSTAYDEFDFKKRTSDTITLSKCICGEGGIVSASKVLRSAQVLPPGSVGKFMETNDFMVGAQEILDRVNRVYYSDEGKSYKCAQRYVSLIREQCQRERKTVESLYSVLLLIKEQNGKGMFNMLVDECNCRFNYDFKYA